MGEALDVVRRQHDAFLTRGLGGVLRALHPEVEIDLSRSGIPDGGVHHGHEGILEGWTQWRGVWDDYSFEVEELTELGDRVLSLTRIQRSLEGSGRRAPRSARARSRRCATA